MGAALVRLLPQFPQLQLQGAIAGPDSPHLGRDCGELAGLAPIGVPVQSDLAGLLRGAGLAISFSSSQTAPAQPLAYAPARIPLLLGTTRLTPHTTAPSAEGALPIPVLA